MSYVMDSTTGTLDSATIGGATQKIEASGDGWMSIMHTEDGAKFVQGTFEGGNWKLEASSVPGVMDALGALGFADSMPFPSKSVGAGEAAEVVFQAMQAAFGMAPGDPIKIDTELPG